MHSSCLHQAPREAEKAGAGWAGAGAVSAHSRGFGCSVLSPWNASWTQPTTPPHQSIDLSLQAAGPDFSHFLALRHQWAS